VRSNPAWVLSGSFLKTNLKCRKKNNVIKRIGPGLPDFIGTTYQNGVNIPNDHKIYQMVKNIPNGHTMYQHLPLQASPKFTQIRIFGFKLCHLATLDRTVPLTRKFEISLTTFSALVNVSKQSCFLGKLEALFKK
jgi:hypothetical protein